MQSLAYKVEASGHRVLRYGLVLVLLWIGAMKFTTFEAQGIKPLIETSPLMSWLYHLLDTQTVSNLLGITEITTGLMIALRPWVPRLAVLGSSIAVCMFLTTLTFLLSLPGWEPSLGGFPALSNAGGFLLKDIVLLATALWSLGEALAAVQAADAQRLVHAPAAQTALRRG